jgi:predicted amidohydrolase YtcJ
VPRPSVAWILAPVLLGSSIVFAAEGETPSAWLFRGGTLIDGTGAPARQADLLVRDGRIAAIGEKLDEPSATAVDVSGFVIAPGFIDLHTHSDQALLQQKTRSNLNYLTQGVTTVVTGNCGGGPIDVAAYLAKIDSTHVGTNVVHLVPHGDLRRAVLGTAERPADPVALEQMRTLLARGLDAGAWGMSTGLIYVPSRYADTAELVALSKVISRKGGFYASHIRNEGTGLLASIDEILTIGREAGCPVHVSHLKAGGKESWGLVVPACERIAEARKDGMAVTADQYPYVASSTQLAAMVVPHWARQGNAADFARIADDPVQGVRLRQAIQEELDRRDGGASVRIARYAAMPARVGRDLRTIARTEGVPAVELVIDIERHGGAQAISFGMSEDDVRYVMARDYVATASDGSAHVPGGGDRPHPRAYGTFPRKIRYSLDEKVISLEQAIRAASGLPAQILGLPDRGTLRVGSWADVLIFDPVQFRDAATFDDPLQYARGVEYLLVNGTPAIWRAKPTGRLAGRALRFHKDGPPDLIVRAGRIWTGDPARPWAEALAARQGEIVMVGSSNEVMAQRGSLTRVVDRPEAFAVPGLIDAHGHVASLGQGLENIDLRGVKDLDEVARLVKARIESVPGDGWIQGQHWDQSLWPGGRFPTAGVLDTVAPNRPVWLTRVDGHAGWANSEAMRRAKITRETSAPSDGQVLRDTEGEPTGVFIDGAMNLVWKVIPTTSRAELTRQVLAAQERILAAGLTGVHDAGLSRGEIEVYRTLDQDHKLKVRIYGMASPPSGGEVAFVGKPPTASKPGRRFELRAIKLFIDGAMGSRGGLLFAPYADDPGNVGLQLIDPKVLEETTAQALRTGWQVCTHAIGDKGNALVLDAYAAALKANPDKTGARLRIEHAQVVRKEDLARFKALGVIASMQPSHASDDMRWAEARLGAERAQGAYAWRWFLDAGVPLAFGSDFPVEVVNPFWGLYAAITRQDEKGSPPGGWHPDQKLTLEEALRAHTAGSAYAAFHESRLGILKPGSRADVTIVDRDLFQASPLGVLESGVVTTIIDGEVTFVKER